MIFLKLNRRLLCASFLIPIVVFATTPPPQEGPPKEFSRNELIQTALNQNFTSRVQWAKLREARAQARLSALLLIPHFSINTLSRLLTPSPAGIIRTAGDTMPFLIPTKWFQKSKDEALERATFDSWALSKADAAFAVEDMFYVTLAEVRAIEHLRNERGLVGSLYSRIKVLEQAGIKQVGSSDDILKITQRIDKSIVDLQNLIIIDYQALSQMAGFDSPQIVQGLKETAEVNQLPDDIQLPSRLEAEENAVKHSLELDQMNYWRKAIKSDKNARRFNWLDPDGDPQGDMGASFPSYLRIADARDEGVIAQIQLEVSQLREHVDQALVGAESSREDYHKALETKATENRRITRFINDMDLGIDFETASLVDALQSLVSDEIDVINSSVAALSAKGRLDRLELVGPYADLQNIEKMWPLFQKALDRDHTK